MGICTVGFVTKPFHFESIVRRKNAISGIVLLEQHTDALITISNDILLTLDDKRTAMPDLLVMLDEVIWQGMLGIKNLIDSNTINCKSLEELLNIIRGKGLGHIGCSTVKGKTIDALKKGFISLETPLPCAAQILLYFYGDISELDASDVVRYIYAVETVRQWLGLANG